MIILIADKREKKKEKILKQFEGVIERFITRKKMNFVYFVCALLTEVAALSSVQFSRFIYDTWEVKKKKMCIVYFVSVLSQVSMGLPKG